MKSVLIAAALAAICSVDAAQAQQGLAAVENLPATIGNQSGNTLRFCTLTDPVDLKSAMASASTGGKKPVLIGWTIEETPPGMSRVVAVSSLSHVGCKAVQPLPAGGVEQIRLHVPYAVIDKAPDWSAGSTALVMAIKNDDMTVATYASRLKRHVNLVTKLFESKGLDGYMVYAAENYEWAYLHWPDEETAKRAFATPDGATGPQDSRSIQRPVNRTQIFP